MKKQTAKKPKVILTAYFVLLAFTAPLFIFSYLPKRIQMQRLRQELINTRNSISAVEAAFAGKKSSGRGILDLLSQMAAVDSKFIKAEDIGGFLHLLSRDAKALGVDIISIQPSEFVVYRSAKGKTFAFEGLECNKIDISLNATGSYKALLDYVRVLESRNSPLVSVKKLRIDKQKQSLSAGLVVEVFAYLPKKEKGA